MHSLRRLLVRESDAMSGHRCHAVDCGREIPPRLLMCKRHWDMVPNHLQVAVYEHYRPGQERDKRPSIEYLDAMQRAINVVAKIEGKAERKLPSETGDQENVPMTENPAAEDWVERASTERLRRQTAEAKLVALANAVRRATTDGDAPTMEAYNERYRAMIEMADAVLAGVNP